MAGNSGCPGALIMPISPRVMRASLPLSLAASRLESGVHSPACYWRLARRRVAACKHDETLMLSVSLSLSLSLSLFVCPESGQLQKGGE